MDKPIRLLHLEDSLYDAELIHSMLTNAGLLCTVTRVDSREAYVAALEEQEFDLILSDYSLPSFDGLTALDIAKEKAPHTPFIFVSGAIGEERAIESLKRGATDYVLKQRLARLVHAVRRAMQEIAERTERHRAERALRESELKFRMIVEASQDWIWEMDTQKKILFSNSSVERILGIPVAEVVGQEAPLLLCAEDRDTFASHFAAGLQRRIGWTGLLLRWQHRNGSYCWLESNATPLVNDSNDVIGFRGIDRDITERIKAEEKLRQNEELFRVIMENIGDLIALIDLNGKRIYNSPSYTSILGDPDLLKGTNSFDDIHPDDRERIIRLFHEAVETGVGRRAEYRLKGKDGRIRHIESQSSVVKDRDGKPMSVVIVSRDITERKQLQEQLLHAQKMESIGTLAGGIAHDFNNVLAIILGYTSLLNRGNPEPEKLTEGFEAITTATQRAAGLVRQLLTFARKTEILFGPVNVNEIVTEVVKMCSQTFPKTISFSSQLAPTIPTIIADRNQLHQALLNLCVNARDAMPDGGRLSFTTGITEGTELRAHAGDARFDRYAFIEIKDTGSGIPPDVVSRIFEPFFTTKGPGKGTGLGLAMVYGAVKAHHGFIDVQSTVGVGTAFRLYLPIPPAEAPVQTADAAGETEVAGGTETILFAEDEESLRELVKALLEERGYRVIAAKDGLEAVELFQKHAEEIALVLTDLELPKLNGWHALLKMKERRPDLPSIIATGFLDESERLSMLGQGARHFVEKPYVPNRLLQKVRAVLDGKGA